MPAPASCCPAVLRFWVLPRTSLNPQRGPSALGVTIVLQRERVIAHPRTTLTSSCPTQQARPPSPRVLPCGGEVWLEESTAVNRFKYHLSSSEIVG